MSYLEIEPVLSSHNHENSPMWSDTDFLPPAATTRSVDVTITNFLEGATPYTPEDPPASSAPRYVTPAPTGVFPASARDRQLSFQERKTHMIAAARRRYIEKHGLDAALC